MSFPGKSKINGIYIYIFLKYNQAPIIFACAACVLTNNFLRIRSKVEMSR